MPLSRSSILALLWLQHCLSCLLQDISHRVINPPFVLTFLLLILFILPGYAQSPIADSSVQKKYFPVIATDTLASLKDSTIKNAGYLLDLKKEQVKKNINRKLTVFKGLFDLNSHSKDSFSINPSRPFHNLFTGRPLMKVTDGYMAYNFNYRSNIDTPYVERNIAQHNVTGRLNFTIAGILPVQATYWVRKSNSVIFRDIADIQLSYNGSEFRNRLQASVRNRLLALSSGLKDSLTEKLYNLKKQELDGLGNLIQGFSLQQLAEANEILRVSRITYDPNLPDSINSRREDSIKKAAAFFLQLYDQTRGKYDSLKLQVDSLKKVYSLNLKKIEQYRSMVSGNWNDLVSFKKLKQRLNEYGMDNVDIPARYRWLLGVRNFSLGRSVANYSDLTAKNISVNGINFEYNSWYYLAVSAGTVNYRFRDFVVNGFNKKPQYLMLGRIGIGRLEKNYFILSAYRGQKQLFAASAENNSVITVTGLSAATKLQVNKTTYITAEIAQSVAPDMRSNPPQSSGKFGLSDKTNQAVAFRLYSYIPVTGSRVEGFYKHTGANFQSFSSFQTNSAMESWHIKAEQNFFKRKLRLTASLRKNEFSNPFIVQAYKSNTIFKSLAASFRMRKWPVVTVGYQPMTQLTILDDQITEHRFQTLNTTIYHLYKIKDVRTASTFMLNQFYNSGSDSGFIYHNATNLYWAQNFFFRTFTANLSASYTANAAYRLNVLDGSIQPHFKKLGAFGVGVKINNLNNDIIKLGGYVTANIYITRKDVLYFSYEHNYLPGMTHGLIRNEMAGIQYVRTFDFKSTKKQNTSSK